MTEKNRLPVPETSDALVAFPVGACSRLIDVKDIPKRPRDGSHSHMGGNGTNRKREKSTTPGVSRLESAFDVTFAATLALREKQIQQNYRPIIGIHKWFARRPGTLFRSLLIAEFGEGLLQDTYWQAHHLRGTIADPFMGGGTSLYEASRLGFDVVGCDINPMSHWLVQRAFATLDVEDFEATAKRIVEGVKTQVGNLFATRCLCCGELADAKYFLWVKQADCPHCSTTNDLFPGHLLAEDERHPLNVVVCAACGELNEHSKVPTRETDDRCSACHSRVHVEGRVKRGKCVCRSCQKTFSVPENIPAIPKHRMWAIEYNCSRCYRDVKGRQFKKPDSDDLARVSEAESQLESCETSLRLPDDEIPAGDETNRLHRWGYRRYRDMFNPRQLLVLGILKETIRREASGETRDALLTVFSDILRYNNMLCRYDTYALKCQDIFSVHGFPVGLVQCENNVLGIPAVGSGGFNHFVLKYLRAKDYCSNPFEVRVENGRKTIVPTSGETIGAGVISDGATQHQKGVELHCEPAQKLAIKAASLDGVFTDPPYFSNVQYAELIDFCYIWLRDFVGGAAFADTTTRSPHEATGNATQGRGITEFTKALSAVFVRFSNGLKPGRPFVFTYHHNDPAAYAPLIVSILDAGLRCTEVLPAAAEMSASLHISGTNSSILDSVFVCRRPKAGMSDDVDSAYSLLEAPEFHDRLHKDVASISRAGAKIGIGDVRCIGSGLVAKLATRALAGTWRSGLPIEDRIRLAEAAIEAKSFAVLFEDTVNGVFAVLGRRGGKPANESEHVSSI